MTKLLMTGLILGLGSFSYANDMPRHEERSRFSECPGVQGAILKVIDSKYDPGFGKGMMCAVEVLAYSWWDGIATHDGYPKTYWFGCGHLEENLKIGDLILGTLGYVYSTSCHGCRPGTHHQCEPYFVPKSMACK